METGKSNATASQTCHEGFTLLEVAAVLFLIALFLGSTAYFVKDGASWGKAEDKGSQLTLMAKKAARYTSGSGSSHRLVLFGHHVELWTGGAGVSKDSSSSVGELEIGDQFEIWFDEGTGKGWQQPERDGYEWEFYTNGLNAPLKIRLAGSDSSFYEVSFSPVAATVQEIGFAEGAGR